MMQFVLMIYQGTTPLPDTDAWAALPQDEQTSASTPTTPRSTRRRALTPGPPLGLPPDATTVRVRRRRDASRPTGPYVGTDGAVGGFLVLEADDLDAAIAVAARIPAARLGGAIEIRPVATYW